MSEGGRPARSFGNAYAVLAGGGAISWASTFVLGTDTRGLSLAAVVAPGAILVAALLALVVLARGGLANLVSPTGTLALALGAFFGFGALLPSIAGQDLANYMQYEFPYTLQELVTAHRVTAAGATVLALVAWIVLRAAPPHEFEIGRTVQADYLRRSAMRLLFIGTGVRLLVTTPYAFGSRTFLLPGSIGSLEILAYVGLLLLAYGVARGMFRNGRDLLVLGAFSLVNLALGLVSLMKMNVFLPVAALMAGAFLARPRARIAFAFALVTVVAFFSVVQPIVTVGRLLFGSSGGTISDSFEAVSTSALLQQEVRENELVQGAGMGRFSYASATVFAVRSYDGGQPGRSISDNILWTFVPRVIWPGKPNMSLMTRDVSIMMSGNDENSVGLGIFAEGYWNGGYLGLVLGASFVGLLLGLFGIVRERVLASFDVPGMLVFWYGCFMGFSIDQYLLPTYVGSWPIILATYMLLKVAIGHAPRRAEGERGLAAVGSSPPSVPDAV